jgi:apolipoprotein N-acyltransferase
MTARLALALLSAVLIAVSFPPVDLGWLAWVALVPLLVACRGRSACASATLGFVTGIGATAGIFFWMFEIPGFRGYHFVAAGGYLALYVAVWSAGVSSLTRNAVPLVFTAPALWVAMDYVRGHAGFLAISWAALAHSQHRNPAILQVAAVTGEYGVTFLVVMGSVVIASVGVWGEWRGVGASIVALMLAHAVGAMGLVRSEPAETVRVAAIQPNIQRGEQATEMGRAAALNRLARLSRGAAAGRPAFIAWPESAVLGVGQDQVLGGRLVSLAAELETPLVVGSTEVVKFATADERVPLGRRDYNAAFVVIGGQPIGTPYQKMRLLPFGEYQPLKGLVRWPTWLAPRVYEITPGSAPVMFTLANGTRFATVICWENLFASFVRSVVRDGASVIVQLTNDNWFGATGASLQHNLASVLRAVEHHVPVVIASNTGPAQIIDPLGRVLASGPKPFTEGFVVAATPLGRTPTIYTRVGDLFAFACIAIAVVGIVGGLRATRYPTVSVSSLDPKSS